MAFHVQNVYLGHLSINIFNMVSLYVKTANISIEFFR